MLIVILNYVILILKSVKYRQTQNIIK